MRALAALLRAGMTLEGAFVAWPERVEGVLTAKVRGVSNRVRLGVAPPDALGADPFGEMTPLLRCVLIVQSRLGGDMAASIDSLAARADAIEESNAGARAQVAGSTLSARMISFLPLVFVPFIPGAGMPFGDPVAMTSLLAGVSLVVVGLKWMKKLLPVVPPPDLGASVALVVASTLRGGAVPSEALTSLATEGIAVELATAEARARLGLSWEESLHLSEDEGLRGLGTALGASRRSGAPLSERLLEFVDERSRAASLNFDTEIRKAPVRMVVPLTVCMLPAFLLLGAGPLVRGLHG